MSRPVALLAGLLAVVSVLAAAGCSSTQNDLSVTEGMPVTLGNTEYTVQISRYLNPSDPEDASYVQGAPPLAKDDYYLGVFMTVKNKGSKPVSLPTRYVVTDTEHNAYEPVPIDNDFSLPLGGKLAAKRQFPNLESAAANGPIQGSMLLFAIPTLSSENRPLTLKIPAANNAAPARVQLDI